VEFFGTLFNLAAVWLVARKRTINWPIGIIGTALFFSLFYQINLYADMFEQVFYVITGLWGWWAWSVAKRKPSDEAQRIVVTRYARGQWVGWALLIAICTGLGSVFMANIHNIFPDQFPEPATYVVLDVFTTVLSFVAQYMLIKKKVESWALWVLVDIIAIGLYWAKGVLLVSLLYAVFLVMASSGLVTWFRTYKKEKVSWTSPTVTGSSAGSSTLPTPGTTT
jgi:nicotinamide mononucleotide transporter